MPVKIPRPVDLGLPEKFERLRPVQEEALEKLLTGELRGEALSLPTGGGKSLVGVMYALITGKPTCYVTYDKGLQDQLLDDFGAVGMVDLRGRSNYACDFKPGLTCQEGYATKCPYKGTPKCAASQAEMRAAVSPLVGTNYAKWTAAKKFGTGMSHFQQVIFDEGHQAPQALADAMQVILHSKEIEQTLKVNFPPAYQCHSMDVWKPWAVETRKVASLELKRAEYAIRTDHRPKSVMHYTHMRNLVKRLIILASARPNDWVVGELEWGYQFDPVRPARYGESALLLRVPKIVVMSATLRPKTLYMMGMRKDSFRFTEFRSDFNAARCPIYYVPTMRIDSRAHDLSALWARIDQVAARRRDRKGIIHTISFARRDAVLASSRFARDMIVNPKGEATTGIIQEYLEAGDGAILVSPSVGAGYDFRRRFAEWQVICKVPFPDSRSPVMKARQQDDKEYGAYLAMQKLEQTAGRIMRDEGDAGETFIFDDHVQWFIPRFAHLASRFFHSRFRRVEVLPPPPPRLQE